MTRIRHALGHPFTQAVVILFVAWVLVRFGIPYIPPLFGIASAPVPQSIVVQYMLIVAVGVLIFVSADQERWRRFGEPVHLTLVAPRLRWLRIALLVLFPALVGFTVYDRARPRVSAPVELRSIHPAPPGQITFRGRTIQLTGLENPLRTRGSIAEHYRTGRQVYYQNCLACHGDLLDGEGPFGHAFSPTPLPFDQSTIAQLTESFVFWRIAKGGPGLPREGAPWTSAMPAWEDFLTEDEIWAVIIFLYQQSGRQPRTWEHASGGQHE